MLQSSETAAELVRLRSLMDAKPLDLTEEQRDALSDAGNRALNDHYHEDLCHCREWPTSCVTRGYFPGMWDTGAFDIGLGAVLGLWESMRADAASARVDELEAERHSTNEALSDAAKQLRVQRDRIAELEASAGKVDSNFYRPGYTYTDVDSKYDWKFRCDLVTTHPEDGERTALGWRHFKGVWEPYEYGEDDWDVQQFVPTKVARKTVPQQRQLEDPHDSDLHHDYALGRDLPTIPRQVTGRCPRCGGTFEDCTCGGAA
ncbi:hypothetical protein [Streptomyces sp. NPDC058872]|uniref:hypothetical protein n=1 Tax=Streptomyces sp. NPDC058872 TaxID=3346661 RepID=UPI0036B77D21